MQLIRMATGFKETEMRNISTVISQEQQSRATFARPPVTRPDSKQVADCWQGTPQWFAAAGLIHMLVLGPQCTLPDLLDPGMHYATQGTTPTVTMVPCIWF